SEWFALAKHTIRGDPALWDIQADIVMRNPPRIEIISGRDRRFDTYIYQKFGHKNQVRVFAPIIFAPHQLEWQRLGSEPPQNLPRNLDKVDKQNEDDQRTVLEIQKKSWAAATNKWPLQVIGTIETGFYLEKDGIRLSPSPTISPEMGRQTAMIAQQRAA